MRCDYYFEVFKASNRRKHFWTRIKFRNSKIVWTSEVYRSMQSAMQPVKKMMRDLSKTASCSLEILTIKVK